MFGFFANASSAVESAVVRQSSRKVRDQCIECLDYIRKVRSIIERHFNNFEKLNDELNGVGNQDTNGYIESDRGKQLKAFLDFSKESYKIFGLNKERFKKDIILTGKIEDFQWLEHACKAAKTNTMTLFTKSEWGLEANAEELLNMIKKNCDNVRSEFYKKPSELNDFFKTRERESFYECWQIFIYNVGNDPACPRFGEGEIQEEFQKYIQKNITFFYNKRMEIIEKIRTKDDMQKVLDEMYILSTRFFFDISCDWIECANAMLKQRLKGESDCHSGGDY